MFSLSQLVFVCQVVLSDKVTRLVLCAVEIHLLT